MMKLTDISTCRVAIAVLCLSLLTTNGAVAAADADRAQADALIAKMTPEEKAGQLSQYFYLEQFPAMGKPTAFRDVGSPGA
jgi:hypothetical protein